MFHINFHSLLLLLLLLIYFVNYYLLWYECRKAVSQTVLQVRRWTLKPASSLCSSSSESSSSSASSSSSSLRNDIIHMKQSPRRRPQPLFSDCSRRQQRQQEQLRNSRRAVSGLLKSTSLTTTDYGWLDAAAWRPRSNVTRSLSDLQQQSADLQPARNGSDLLNFGQVREALEPIHEAAEQTVEQDSGRVPRRVCSTTADMELNKENVGPRSRCSSSVHTTASAVNKSNNVACSPSRQLSCMLPSSSTASLSLNPNRRGTKDGDRFEVGGVTSERSSGRRALIPTNCAVSADDNAAVNVGAKFSDQPPTEFRRGLTRRSFSLPRIRAKFSLKVVGCLCLWVLKP